RRRHQDGVLRSSPSVRDRSRQSELPPDCPVDGVTERNIKTSTKRVVDVRYPVLDGGSTPPISTGNSERAIHQDRPLAVMFALSPPMGRFYEFAGDMRSAIDFSSNP